MENNTVAKHPLLAAIVGVGDTAVVSVKGGIGKQVAQALQETYKKEVDPQSGYVLESMQIDENTNAAIYASVVDEKDHYADTNKYYSVVYTVDPVTISPVDLIDFKAAAIETTNDDGTDPDMVVYMDNPPEGSTKSSALIALESLAQSSNIKTIYGMPALIEHLNGVCDAR